MKGGKLTEHREFLSKDNNKSRLDSDHLWIALWIATE